MNKFVLALIFSFFTLSVFSQQNSVFQSDLTSLYNALKETPSYKEQITGQKKKEYDLLYEKLKTGKIKPSRFDSLYKLSELLWPIRDNHLALYERPDPDFKSSMLNDSVLVRKFRESSRFKSYPLPLTNVDKLEHKLAGKPLGSIEGIYYQGEFKIGIYADKKEKRFKGVILASKSPIWKKGEMVLFLTALQNGRYRGVYANLYNKDLLFIKNEKLTDGRLFYLGSKKESPPLLGHINYNKPLMELKTIDSNIQYLRLGNFRTSTDAMALSQQFYTKIKDSLTAKNLIVDIRNNPGGGFKSSAKFLSLLKRYSSRGKIYVLVNSRTVSNAEQFSIRLKGYTDVVTFGETTMGMITYGSNYGKTVSLPSGKYDFYPTDMTDAGNFLTYEESGYQPDVKLDQKSDWIEQLIQRINQNK